MGCVFSQGYCLEDEEGCPSQSGDDEQNGAFDILSLVVVIEHGRGWCVRLAAVLCAEKVDGISFIKCHQHGST